MTIEAWVLPRALGSAWRTVVLKEQTGNYAYGLYASTGTGRPSANVVSGGADHDLRGPAALPLDTWVHVAATYDAANLRLYVNGTLAASVAATGSISTSTGALRIGGNNLWPEFFQGRIDEVRIYNRALTQSQIQSDMASPAATDTKDPTVIAVTPASGAVNVTIDTQPSASFSEAIDPSTLNASTFELRDGGGVLVPATIAYDPLVAQATLSPSSGLLYNTTYTARIKSGATGVKDMSGRPLAADYVWAFSLQPSPPPVAVLTSAANPFTSYLGEILRAEGYSFAQLQASLISPAVLDYFDVVVLGDVPLTAAQVTILTNWVTAGGNLIAMRPDKQLAGLLGLSDAGSTLANGYILVDNGTQAGAGIVGQTIQYHGTADRYTLSGATGIAALYSTATAATPNVAVSLRTVGSNGGQAAAFTYDLARSIVLTRQGNPAWVGQDRDGVFPIRPNDLFYGAAAGDVQPDWVNTAKLAIPQADEQQRLLSNLIVTMARDRKPLPRFWYLPRGEKATIVMTGDDHAIGGTAGRFDQYKAASPAGCVVALWECVRSTSYIYPASPLTNAQAAGYVAEGFEVALHGSTTGGSSCDNWTPASLESVMTSQLSAFATKYTERPRAQDTSDPLRHVERLVDDAENRAGTRHSPRHELLPLSGRLDRRDPGLHDGLRDDHAVRRPRRDTDRRLPGAHAHDRRGVAGVPRDGQRTAGQGSRARRLLRRVHGEHAHGPGQLVGLGRHRRFGTCPERACRVRQADVGLGGRPERIVLQCVLLERKLARVHDRRRRDGHRTPRDVAAADDEQDPQLDHAQRRTGVLLDGDDQGHRVRNLPGRRRRIRRNVRLTGASRSTGLRRSP